MTVCKPALSFRVRLNRTDVLVFKPRLAPWGTSTTGQFKVLRDWQRLRTSKSGWFGLRHPRPVGCAVLSRMRPSPLKLVAFKDVPGLLHPGSVAWRSFSFSLFFLGENSNSQDRKITVSCLKSPFRFEKDDATPEKIQYLPNGWTYKFKIHIFKISVNICID